jgi:hypothetical protein
MPYSVTARMTKLTGKKDRMRFARPTATKPTVKTGFAPQRSEILPHKDKKIANVTVYEV